MEFEEVFTVIDNALDECADNPEVNFKADNTAMMVEIIVKHIKRHGQKMALKQRKT